MSINIYVGNLSYDTREEGLRELFEAFGAVESVKIITDQFTGRSRGFGFVEMTERDEGTKAIEELNAKDFEGRSLKVNEARPRRGPGGGGGGGGRGGRDNRRQW
jgi:cold-inducible RNA-binding protein